MYVSSLIHVIHFLLTRYTKGERDVADVEGMNAFAASIILSQTPLQKLIDKAPQERMQEYAELVGMDRMVR